MRLLVFFQLILCVYCTWFNGNLLPVRAEGRETAKEKNENCVPEKPPQKREDEVLQTKILRSRLPRHDDVSIYYHTQFLLIRQCWISSQFFRFYTSFAACSRFISSPTFSFSFFIFSISRSTSTILFRISARRCSSNSYMT